MSVAVIELVGEDVLCSVEGGGNTRLSIATAQQRLEDWASRYDRAAERNLDPELLAIGTEMFGWLNDSLWASAWADGARDRVLDIRARRPDDPREGALLDAPWELLARNGVPLAQDPRQLFTVARRVGAAGQQHWPPKHRELQLMFMAAASEGQVELDHEQEEAAILEATKGDGRVHVVVEETGALAFLGGRLTAEEGPFEALHLSCHGTIEEARGPVLLLGAAEGGDAVADAGDVIAALGEAPPPLVVLSACRTAERASVASIAGGAAPGAAASPAVGAEVSASFARQLVTQVANVIGWDGSVYDQDAIAFARDLYGELGRGATVPRAVAVARRALLTRHGTDRSRRTPLAPGAGLSRAGRRRAFVRGHRRAAQEPGAAAGSGVPRPDAAARAGGDAGRVRRATAADPGGAAGVPRRRGRAGARHGGARQVEPRRPRGEPHPAPSGGDLRAL